ncbi:abscisic-aldehyde oxidase-like [Gossypium australe]|uniref:Abscisic-aldehyde oxidase-like n=1 Tax=Gossypium australe TaxID=47621 RepID=A0A5B6VZL7_9ROSI|nr:abscisic-aldehyde oxidase-like [Gossypium australe]
MHDYVRHVLHKSTNEDVSLGSWFIGHDVQHIDDQRLCSGRPPDTQKKEDMAANLAVVDYDKKNLEPILSIEEAFEKCSFYEVPPLLNLEPIGAFSKGMAESDHQILHAEVVSILLKENIDTLVLISIPA